MSDRASLKEQRLYALQEKAAHSSEGPGVYRMLGADGKILYIGKAKSLRNRIKSYFQKNVSDEKTKALVSKIYSFETILTQSEAEALILEAIQIKRHKPRYNILLKDDKSYPYVMLDESQTYPRLLYVRRPRKQKNAKLYGPYASATALRSALRTVTRIFRLRDCSDSEFANRSRPCLNYQIGTCSAPCTQMIEVKDYKRDVEKSLQVLGGFGNEALQKLEEEMNHFASLEEFEQAAKVRDQINLLEETIQKKKQTGETVEQESRAALDQDVIGWYRKPDSATIALLFVRKGNLIDSTVFHLSDIEEKSDSDVLFQFLAQFYLTDDNIENSVSSFGDSFILGAESKTFPQEVLLPFSFTEVDLLVESLGQLGHKTKIVVPQRGVKHDLMILAEKNAENSFDEKQREKGSIYRVLAELKIKLKLDNYPRRIECFDISNLGDSGIVASRVTFIEGKPDKTLYRHYKIRSTATQNDFASMREVIERRLVKTLQDDQNYEEPPDLMVIDGGKGQLAMAVEVIKELNITGLDLVSLAKAKTVGEEEVAELAREGREVERAFERIFKPGRMNPILLPPDHSVTHLLQRIRDEAHRFAVEFQRKQRKLI